MRIEITIEADEISIKKAIAKGWNKRFREDLTHTDIEEVSNKEDIISAIPYLSSDDIEIVDIT
jgi:hypothetical protein